MKILCAESVLNATYLFSTLGDMHVLPDHKINSAALRDMDILIIRSGTPVNETLLAYTHLQVVATATAGIDHLDLQALQQRHIQVFQAAGSNAASVAEYVVHGLLAFSKERHWPLTGKTIGLIGYGAVSQCLKNYLIALGLQVIAYDPLLPQQTSPLVSLSQLQQQADIISLHCPLVKEGEYPTYHLLNAEFFAALKPGVLLVNTARGAVVDTVALLTAIEQGQVCDALIDVWEGEPLWSLPLMEKVFLATPHIAGYSYTGRLKGSYDIYQQLCAYLQQPITITWQQLHEQQQRTMNIESMTDDRGDMQGSLLKKTYDPRQDDLALRALASLSTEERAQAFKALRQQYPPRYEHSDYAIHLATADASLTQWLQAMAFKVK